MRTLKLTMAATALILSSIVCHAQTQEKGTKLIEKLGLSKEQSDKLKTVREAQKIENKAFREKMDPIKLQMKALRVEKKSMNESKMKEIQTILTSEQFLKFKELKANRSKSKKK